MNLYVVTYLEIDLGRLEFHVDKIFNNEESAFQYCQIQTGANRNRINYEVHEIEEVEE